jgi:hypothetical protein
VLLLLLLLLLLWPLLCLVTKSHQYGKKNDSRVFAHCTIVHCWTYRSFCCCSWIFVFIVLCNVLCILYYTLEASTAGCITVYMSWWWCLNCNVVLFADERRRSNGCDSEMSIQICHVEVFHCTAPHFRSTQHA